MRSGFWESTRPARRGRRGARGSERRGGKRRESLDLFPPARRERAAHVRRRPRTLEDVGPILEQGAKPSDVPAEGGEGLPPGSRWGSGASQAVVREIAERPGYATQGAHRRVMEGVGRLRTPQRRRGRAGSGLGENSRRWRSPRGGRPRQDSLLSGLLRRLRRGLLALRRALVGLAVRTSACGE